MALLVAEQNLWFARQCTESVYLVQGGRVVFEGTWNDFDDRRDELAKYLAV